MRARRQLRRRLPGAVLGAALAVGITPGPAAGMAVHFELPGRTISVVTVDPGDRRSPTILRLVDEVDGAALETWSVAGTTWRRDARMAIELDTADDDATPALLRWSRDDRDAVLLVTPTGSVQGGGSGGEACCVTIGEVEIGEAGLALRTIRTESTGPADAARTLDVDADGTDELVLTSLVGGDALLDPQRTVEILRLDGDGFVSTWAATAPISSVAVVPGDADGVPGDELYLGPEPDGELRRVAWRGGGPALETTTLNLGAPRWAEVVGTIDGAVVVRTPDALVAQHWPRGGTGDELARVRIGAQGGVGIVGTGADAVVVTSRGYLTPQGAIGVYDAELASLDRYGESSAAGLVWDLVVVHAAPLANLDRSVFPYIGPIPVDLDDPPGFLANGMLATTGRDGHRVRPASPLLGYTPVGLAGPEGAFIVLRGGPGGPGPGTVSLRSSPTDGDGRLVVVPIRSVLDPEPIDLATMLRFDGALRQPTGDARATVRSGSVGFGVDIAAPPGSIVAVIGERFDARTVGDEPWRLRIEPRTLVAAGRAAEDDRPFRRWLLVVLPDGTALAERWNGVFVHGVPSVELVTGEHGPGGAVDVRGLTEPGNRVVVAGSAVAVDADGAFATTVEGGLLPRAVVVRVADPFGGERRAVLDVPGLIDLGGLPWIAAAAVATLVAGAAMYVRTPRYSARVPGAADGEVRLEELDPD